MLVFSRGDRDGSEGGAYGLTRSEGRQGKVVGDIKEVEVETSFGP